ncbi:MAG: CPXCG motif-containing cysteine-rich protein [Nitrospirae bacterium]|nr:MAG: CPXCG motif-containing cysteine-rich protein [Nitrospirota bacterium]
MVEAVAVACPYCGERVELLVDRSAGPHETIEDCPVCCRPMEVRVAEGPRVEVRRDDE